MYEIRKDGAVLALTEKPTYIYRHEEGFYALCDEAQAQGIAVNGTPYSLHGRPAIEGCETVILVETDAGRILQRTEQTNSIAFVTLAEAGHHRRGDGWWGAHGAIYAVGISRELQRRATARLPRQALQCLLAHTSQDDWAPDAASSLVGVCVRPCGRMACMEPAGGGAGCLWSRSQSFSQK